MNIKELLEFFQICPYCQTPMPLYFKFLRLEREGTINDDICSLIVAGIGKLNINILSNTWSTSTNSSTTYINLNNRNFVVGRKCTCSSQTNWQSSGLIFNENKTLSDIMINSLMFQIITNEQKIQSNLITTYDNINQQKIVVTSDYKSGYTSLSMYKLIPKYYLQDKYFYRQFPLINFDFSSKEKIENKLNMIMTFL